MNFTLAILYMILPVLAAGLTFIFILKKRYLIFLSYPLDFNFRLYQKRLFGKNKTFKGPTAMGIFTSLYGWVITLILNNPFNLNTRTIIINFLIIGLLYSLGELPNSFLKRRLGIPPGKQPKNNKLSGIVKTLDTTDSLIFCGVGYLLLFNFSIPSVVSAVIVGSVLHILTDSLMFNLSLKS